MAIALLAISSSQRIAIERVRGKVWVRDLGDKEYIKEYSGNTC